MTNNNESSLLLQSTHLENYAKGNYHNLNGKTDIEKDFLDLSEDNIDNGFSQLPPFIKNNPEGTDAAKKGFFTPLTIFIMTGIVAVIFILFMMLLVYRK